VGWSECENLGGEFAGVGEAGREVVGVTRVGGWEVVVVGGAPGPDQWHFERDWLIQETDVFHGMKVGCRQLLNFDTS
jgi:hypothetical protein